MRGATGRPLEEPRFGAVPAGKGHYESFYLAASAPGGGRALWVRNTILKRPGAAPRPTLWVTAFEHGRPPRRARVTLDDPPVADAWMRSGPAHAGPAGFTGTVEGASWDLRVSGGEEPQIYLPARRLYDGGLLPTKAAALHPRAEVSGTIEVEGERWDVEGWDGMVGHNWGVEHAEHWIWLHGAFEDGGWIDLGLGRSRIGVLLPWLGGGGLSLDGARTKLGGSRGRPKVTITAAGIDIAMPAGGRPLRLAARWDEPSTVRWDYASPAGAERDVRNCSVADLDVTWGDRRIEVRRSAQLELGVPAGG